MSARARKKPAKRATRRKTNTSDARRIAIRLSAAFAIFFLALCAGGLFYSTHSPEWLESAEVAWPGFLVRPLRYFGDRVRYITDAIGATGHDVVYDYDEPAPEGQILFAGAPVRTGDPAPADIVTIAHDAFMVGWSPTLRRPAWVAYHVPVEARFEDGKRPQFQKDRSVRSSPSAGDYAHSGYDRGHMAPNHAIVSRFGPDEQRKTFLMTNIAPQTPALNRGPWREVEHQIADIWPARYGEIWVIVAAVPVADPTSRETIAGADVDVPEGYGMVIVAQTEDGVRALAVLLRQSVDYDAFPMHSIVSIDELEERTGLDFLPELPEFLQRPLEAERATRLWPPRLLDILKLVSIRFR